MKKNYFSSKISRERKSNDFNEKITRNFRSLVGSMVLFGLPISMAYGQTNPTPQPMPYTAGHFDSLTGSSPYNYPAGWQGWKLNGTIDANYEIEAVDDVALTKGGNNLTIASVTDFVGKLGFYSTTSTRTAPVLAVNAIDYQQIKVKYDINVQRKTSNRVMGIQLQYRIGTEGAFTPIESSTTVFDGANLAQNNTGTDPLAGATVTKEIEIPAEAYHQSVLQFRWVVARLQGGSGDNIGFSIDNVEVTGITNPCANNPLPYFEDFTGLTSTQLPECSVVEDVDALGNTWKVFTTSTTGFTPPLLRYGYNSTRAANDWFFTKGLALEAGTTYRLRYKLGTGNYDEKLKISLGNSAESAAMTQTIFDYGTFRKTTPGIEDKYFTVPTSGNYYIGFYAYSAANMLNINIDDISVEVAPTCVEPGELTSSEITARTATVSWTASISNPSGYEYYLATDTTAPTAETEATGTATTTSVALANLTPETTYNVWVRSVCSPTDKSAWTTTAATFTTLISCPAPTELATSNITTSGAEINWTSTATGFEYIVTTTNTAPEATATGTTVNTNSATLTGLNDTTTYYWWVRAICDTDDKSSWSGSSFQTLQIPAAFPFSDNFNESRWVFANGTQTNKFYIGTPEEANNVTYADNKLFVSNNGVNNSYATTASSVYAYRDITLPADITLAKISFDWILRGEGGSTATSIPYDYGRFYIVPTTVTPNAGTNLGYEENIANAIYSLKNNPVTTPTGRKHYLLYNPSNTYTGAYEDIAHTYVDEAVNLAEFAGQTVRLVFFFRNDSGTYPPSLAIDNFEITEAPSCLTVSDLNATNVTFDQATLNWVGNSDSYTYYFSTTNTTPTGDVGTTTTESTVNLTDLEASTTYYWWVKATCDTTNTWIAGSTFTTNAIPTAFPFTDNFDTLNWTFANGTQTNKFYVGTPETSGNITFDNGKLFISNTGVKAEYGATANHTYAYKDVILPADLTLAKLTFKWIAAGESTPWDYGRFYITSTDVTPEAGIEINRTATTVPNSIFNANHDLRTTNTFAFYKGSTYTAGTFNEQAHTYLKEDLDLSEYAGQTVRLVFYWRNDGLTQNQPSLVVDDFELTYAPTCLTPTNLTVSDVSSSTATLNWNGYSDEYMYYYSTTNVLPETGFTTSEPTVTVEGLDANTTYYWWIKAVCDTDSSVVEGQSFTTLLEPKPYPFTDDFNGTNNWMLVNGTQTNKLFIGTPVDSELTYEDGALFVSNNGTSNTYTITSASSSYVYVDVEVPTDVDSTELAFDWYNKGENIGTSIYDFGRVFVTPTSYTPTAGTNITSGGTITGQIFGSTPFYASTGEGATFNEAKGQFTTSLDLSEYAGQTVRLIIYWRNDTSGGTQPPLSVDNFYFGPTRNLSTNNLSKADFAYYPNPVQNELNIRGEQKIANIEVYNLAGQTVDSVKVGEKTYQLNTSKLNAGVYMVKVTFENGTSKTVKIIKK